jgi:DNA-binding transcriptional MocR family regulator
MHYRQKRDVMVEALRQEFGDEVRWPAPRGGFFLWATLPAAIDSNTLIERAIRHGVIYVAGEAFFVNAGPRNLIRLSFSSPTVERIRQGVARLGTAIREELAEFSPAAGSVPGRPEAR